MKKLFIAPLCFTFLSANAQTINEVVQQYSANMGGLDSLNKVSTAKFTGTLNTQGNDFPFTTQVINGKAMRTDVEVMGQSVNNVYNNGKGWKINPFAGAATTTEVTGNELATLKVQASLANNLMDYKSRGHQAELLGQEDIEGVKAFKIKLTSKDDGKITTYFISTASYLLVKSIGKREIAGNEFDVETFYSDMKDVDGLKFCMQFIQKIEGQVF
jgi:hypothetical protein